MLSVLVFVAGLLISLVLVFCCRIHGVVVVADCAVDVVC